MCGIAGFVDKKAALSVEKRQKIVAEMAALIEHRGPDGVHTSVVDTVGIAHTRLAILDLSKDADQPMWNETNTKVLTFNGELYNHLKVREKIPESSSLLSHGDTATLLCAYEKWGPDCLAYFKGMFAFSLLDTHAEEVFLAVDRFSIKPLYYLDTDDWFAWSSEIKAFAALPGFSMSVETDTLSEYMKFRSIAGEQTLAQSIRKFLPGEKMVYSLKTHKFEKDIYWGIESMSSEAKPVTEALIKDLFVASVNEHLLSDVPVGIQLSGGVDSSLVSALVRKALPNELHSFSIGLAEEEWNEFKYSRLVANTLGTIHHEIIFTEQDFCEALPIATYYYDEPINHSHSIPMMILANEARKYVKVLMSGEGADEIFGGYRRYVQLLSGSPTEEDILFSNQFVVAEQVQQVMSTRNFSDFVSRRKVLQDAEGRDPFFKTAWYDLRTYLTPLLLRQDKMGMASGLENRVPFLDHELVTAAMQLMPEEKIADGEGKVLLKRIAAEYLPQEVVYRTKVGFSQPIAMWLSNPEGLGKYLRFFTDCSANRPYLNYEAIQGLIREHQHGTDRSAILWTLITLEIWTRIFVDGVDRDTVWETIS